MLDFKHKFKLFEKSTGRKYKPVTIDVVESIFEMYCAELPIDEIASKISVSRNTVANYITHGSPSRGIEPLRERRARIIRRIQDANDSKLVDTVSRTRAAAIKAVEAIGDRVVTRVNRAHLLEDPDLYHDYNNSERLATLAKAYNPKPSDLKAVIDATARFEQSQVSTGSVNVVQNQGQSQSQEVSADEVDFVKAHIENMQRCMGEDERRVLSKFVEDVNIMSESDRRRLSNDGKVQAILEGNNDDCGSV